MRNALGADGFGEQHFRTHQFRQCRRRRGTGGIEGVLPAQPVDGGVHRVGLRAIRAAWAVIVQAQVDFAN